MGKILDASGQPYETTEATLRRRLSEVSQRNRVLMSKIDAASSTDENSKHWAQADAFGPNAALDPATRARLRNRGRYETINNSYCKGLVRSLAYDFIGTGPRLQLSIFDQNGETTEPLEKAAKTIEQRYAKWARAVRLGHKYRLMKKASARDGGSFGVLETYPALKNPVKLNVRMFEDEECETPFEQMTNPFIVDGVELDSFREPVAYWFLTYHPGELTFSNVSLVRRYVRVPAERVLHWYEQDRIGQVRGIPEITASLPLFAQMRRYTLATIIAAEIAAMLAGVMTTAEGVTGADETIQSVDAFEVFDLVRGSLLTLPAGRDAKQFSPEQPTTNYPDFKREILNEAGRGAGAPLNVITGNSSGYNFSSARLDFVPYVRGHTIDRDDFRTVVADKVFETWVEEGAMVYSDLFDTLPPMEEWTWSWNWDSFYSLDPEKDARADDIRLRDGTTTYAEIYAAYGQDYVEQFNQMAREKKLAEKLGLQYPLLAEAVMAADEKLRSEPEDDEEDDDGDATRHHRNGYSLNGRHR